MTLNTINMTYVLDAIGRLKNGKASGPDKVTIKLVKDAAKFIAYPHFVHFQLLNKKWDFS